MPKQIPIELVYALPDRQTLLSFEVEEGTTLEQAIALSDIQDHHPELDLAALKFGIFGKITPKTHIMRERDRIELYRPLIADPKEVRKQRAAAGKAMKKGGDESGSSST